MATTAHERLINILADLVAFPSESGRLADCGKCFDYLEEYLMKRGLETKRHTSKGRPSLVATSRKTKQPKVLLQAHIDVVPGGPGAYKLVKKNGRLQGRGVYDMKFAAACYLLLVDELQAQLDEYDFGIMFTSDEEVGGENGVAMLLKKGYGAGVCVLPDGGNDWKIETTSNGGWMVRVIAAGRSAHGSRPWEGENAIYSLMEALHEIKAEFGTPAPTECTLTVSQIEGGQAVNQVPDKAEATLDIRFADDKSYAAKRRKVEAVAGKWDLKLQTIDHAKAYATDITRPPIAHFMKLAEELRGEPLSKTRSFGSSDARFFAEQDIPTIVMRPTGGGAHSADEWIDEAALGQFYELLKVYVKEAAYAKA